MNYYEVLQQHLERTLSERLHRGKLLYNDEDKPKSLVFSKKQGQLCNWHVIDRYISEDENKGNFVKAIDVTELDLSNVIKVEYDPNLCVCLLSANPTMPRHVLRKLINKHNIRNWNHYHELTPMGKHLLFSTIGVHYAKQFYRGNHCYDNNENGKHNFRYLMVDRCWTNIRSPIHAKYLWEYAITKEGEDKFKELCERGSYMRNPNGKWINTLPFGLSFRNRYLRENGCIESDMMEGDKEDIMDYFAGVSVAGHYPQFNWEIERIPPDFVPADNYQVINLACFSTIPSEKIVELFFTGKNNDLVNDLDNLMRIRKDISLKYVIDDDLDGKHYRVYLIAGNVRSKEFASDLAECMITSGSGIHPAEFQLSWHVSDILAMFSFEKKYETMLCTPNSNEDIINAPNRVIKDKKYGLCITPRSRKTYYIASNGKIMTERAVADRNQRIKFCLEYRTY